MKYSFGSLLLAAAFCSTCSAQYGSPIKTVDELRYQLTYFLDQQLNVFIQYLEHPSYWWHELSQQIGKQAVYAMDRQAGDHVLKARSNYSSTARIVNEILNSTRDFLANDLTAQKDLILSTLPEIDSVAADLTQILRNRNCPQDSIHSFLSLIYDSIYLNIQNSVSDVIMHSQQIFFRGSIPVFLIENFYSKIRDCLYSMGSYQYSGLKCILRTEDYYLSSSVNMVRESIHQVEQYFVGLNYRVTQSLVSDVDHELIHAYQAVFKYDCLAASTESTQAVMAP